MPQMISRFLLLGTIFAGGAMVILLAVSVICYFIKAYDEAGRAAILGIVFTTAALLCFICFWLSL